MNPYTLLADTLHITPHHDARLLSQENAIDRSVSHAAYRLVDTVDRLLFRRGR